jgi:hypothetical protein
MRFSLKICARISVTAKFVLHLMSEVQEQNCVDFSQELVKHANADENSVKNITGDKT